ncbi:MAG TPA: hypothetical protein VG276_28000 [Actinomycetes bacterium]|jgi:hypothetical protein|nr:hypothetical protein [Actinomycetes bacterium]
MRSVVAKRLRFEQARLRAAGITVPRRLRTFRRWLGRYQIGRRP